MITQLVFASQTATSTLATDTPIGNAQVDFSTLTSTSTSTFTPIPTLTSTPSVTVLFVGPTYTPSLTSLPTLTNTPSITPTEPILITPTLTPSATQIGAGISAVAMAATNVPIFDNSGATGTQNALNLQATSILETATMGAAAQQTLIATSLGTGAPLNNSQQIEPTATPGGLAPTAFMTAIPAIINGTPQGTPGTAGSGAAGPVTGNCIYTVAEGDRLFRIALRFNMSSYQLAYANRLVNPDAISPGETLTIPNCNATPGAVVTTAAGGSSASALQPNTTAQLGTTSSGGGQYMVTDGDTLYGIATRYHVRVMSLAQTNNIANISLIYIGQTLTIPAS